MCRQTRAVSLKVPGQALTATPAVTPPLGLATPAHGCECGVDFLSQDTCDTDVTSHLPDKAIDSLLPHIAGQWTNTLHVHVNGSLS